MNIEAQQLERVADRLLVATERHEALKARVARSKPPRSPALLAGLERARRELEAAVAEAEEWVA